MYKPITSFTENATEVVTVKIARYGFAIKFAVVACIANSAGLDFRYVPLLT